MRLGVSLGVNSGGGVPADYALEFNGTDEYLQIALPAELVANGNFETGTNSFWSTAGTTPDWANTEVGKTGNYCLKLTKTGAVTNLYRVGLLTVGKKYKFCTSTRTTFSSFISYRR